MTSVEQPYLALKDGWLNRDFEQAETEIRAWPVGWRSRQEPQPTRGHRGYDAADNTARNRIEGRIQA